MFSLLFILMHFLIITIVITTCKNYSMKGERKDGRRMDALTD
jgi:hypothetical protein